MSTQRCLAVLEVSQKQSYIFSSNRLKENIGASIVISEITTNEKGKGNPARTVSALALASYGKKVLEGVFPSLPLPEQATNSPEAYLEEVCLNDGGGKSIFRFEGNHGMPAKEEAKAFVKAISLYLLKNYYGTEPFFAIQTYTEEENIADKIDELYKNLAISKNNRRQSFRLTGIGLAKKCPSSSLPVNEITQELGYSNDLLDFIQGKESLENGKFNLSTYIKLEAEMRQGDKEIICKDKKKRNISFPTRFDQLGGDEGEKSMVAIVVIDGNGMGKKFEQLKNNFNQQVSKSKKSITEMNRKYLEALCGFSRFIADVYEQAMDGLVAEIYENKNSLKNKINLQRYTEKMVPIRPLISAGDDICFITDARIGMSAAKIMLQKIREISVREYAGLVEKSSNIKEYFDGVITEGEGLYASAGVVICGQKYPFSRAHDFAEKLCRNAKEAISRNNDELAIDFHVIMGEARKGLKEERESSRTSNMQEKHARPYIILNENQEKKSENKRVSSYSEFEDAVTNLKHVTGKVTGIVSQDEDKIERVGRSQIKELAYYIQQGADKAENFIHNSGVLKRMVDLKRENFTIYLDAIEMLDLSEEIVEKNETGEEGKA